MKLKITEDTAVIIDTKLNTITIFDEEKNNDIVIELQHNSDVYITDKDGENHLVVDLVTQGVLS